jgi:N-acetyl-alpha-D-muramate 1-phosphate uridylyltransferase
MPADISSFPVALLAGGLATRLRPLTEKIPKSLVEVAGRPFLAHQLELLRSRGIRRVVLCVGHLGEQIEKMFGDGSAWGMQLAYSFDGPKLLGTGGALRKALPLLGSQFFVLYGDSYLPIEYAPVAEAFAQSGQPALMTVFANAGRYDTSNVWFEQGTIKCYDKQARLPQMQHIDFGLCVLQRGVLESMPLEKAVDFANVLRDLSARGQLAGFEVQQRFYEIGSPSGLAELDELLGGGKPKAQR